MDELLAFIAAGPLLAGFTIGIVVGAAVATVLWMLWIYRAIEQ